ncbi:MAG TPA: LytTR family transcriptional regulator DNA-binding domain-containing protein [Chitinophagaceae bacterium]
MKEETTSDLFILAVEDDAIFAETLELVLQEMGYVNYRIVDNAAAALKIFNEEQPDILLADIDINGPLNGIELASIISSIRRIPVVFITSFADSETFRKAKQTRPAAYIVKPYHATNLQAAIELALENEQGNQSGQPGPSKEDAVYPLSDALFIKYNSKLFKIRIPEIVFIEVEEKYCYIHTASKRFAVNMRLKNLMDQLPADTFVQIHRSYAVKLDAIEEINTDQHLIRIKGTEIPIGKTYREMFLAKLKMI